MDVVDDEGGGQMRGYSRTFVSLDELSDHFESVTGDEGRYRNVVVVENAAGAIEKWNNIAWLHGLGECF
jgi:hypothetical protein